MCIGCNKLVNGLLAFSHPGCLAKAQADPTKSISIDIVEFVEGSAATHERILLERHAVLRRQKITKIAVVR